MSNRPNQHSLCHLTLLVAAFSAYVVPFAPHNAAAQPFPDNGLKEFNSKVGGFRVRFPGTPQEVSTPDNQGGIQKYEAFIGRNDGAFLTTFTDNPSFRQAKTKDEQIKMLEAGQQKAVAAKNGRLLLAKDIMLEKKYFGREYAFETEKSKWRAGVYFVNGYLYQVTILGEKDFAESKEATEFLDSFKLVSPVKLIVRVPADATLELEGQETKGKGESRQFQIPAIPTGADSQYHLTATWKADEGQRTVSRTLNIRGGQAVEIDMRNPIGWPAYAGDLAGNQEVRVENPNTFTATVALRSAGRGKDFEVPANSTKSVSVPNGRYEIYFQYSTDPEGLYQGDSFTLSNNGVEIQIVKVVNGNYGIKKVN